MIRHILDRRDGGGASVVNADRRKIALVVQGGCMRGVFTAGALCALEELGVRQAFDAIYASSGGAVNAAYFLADQIALGTSIYTSDINNRTFIDFRRIFAGSAADIDYCFDEVVGRRKRLDLEAVLGSPIRLTSYVTSPHRARAERLVQHEIDRAPDLLALLKASAAMPLVYRRPVLFRGERYLDGGLLAPVPLLDAIGDGSTDILVLLSRPLATSWSPPPGWLRWLIVRSIGWTKAPALAKAWRAAERDLARALDLLRHAGSGARVHLACVAPPPEFPVSRWTTDRGLLVGAARTGALAVLRLFGVEPQAAKLELLPSENHAA